MKGVVGGSAKRRWKILVIPVVGLVVLSMLVPLVFLLGFHNGSHSTGDDTQQRNSQPVPLSKHAKDVYERLTPTFPKEFGNNFKRGGDENGFSMTADLPKQAQPVINVGPVVKNYTGEHRRNADESDLICEFTFGGYCLWRREHKEKMKDTVVKRMKDLLFVARAYYPSIAKLPAFGKLSHEMKQNIQDFERVLSETTADKDLPPGGTSSGKQPSFPVPRRSAKPKKERMGREREPVSVFTVFMNWIIGPHQQSLLSGLHCQWLDACAVGVPIQWKQKRRHKRI